MTPPSSINHHLTEALIVAYAAGTLPEAMNLILATHISLCDECRAAVEAQEVLGGALLDQTPVEAVSDTCLDGALALIRDTAPVAAPKPRRGDSVFPAPLVAYTGGGPDAVRWRSAGLGVKQAVLSTAPGATARLLHIPAGADMPDHSHRGLELTLVLKGAFTDETGRFARGDIEIADDDLEHRPVADRYEDCICLAVTEAPLRFRSWIPRLAQPFVGI